MMARNLALAALLMCPLTAPTQTVIQQARPYPPQAAEKLVNVSYPVADLVVPVADFDEATTQRTEENWLIGKIMQVVAPASWKETGGRGTVKYIPLAMGLEITQTPAIQAQVKDLLETMRRFMNVEVCIETRVMTIEDASALKVRTFFPHLMRDGQAVLSEIEMMMLMETAQGIRELNVMQAPKITVFPGQRAKIAVHDALDVQLCPMVSGDLRKIDLDLKASVQGVKFQRQARLAEGRTLVLPGRSDKGTVLLLATPRLIISLEESVTQQQAQVAEPQVGMPAPLSEPQVIQAAAAAAMPAPANSPAQSSAQTPIALSIRVCQGDPLGSVEANTLQILTQPQVATLPNQVFRVDVGNTIALPGGKTDNIGVNLEGTPGNIVDGKVRLDMAVSLTSAGETSAERAVTHTARTRAVMTLKLGETTRFRFGAPGGEQQTWVEVTAREMQPQGGTSRQPEHVRMQTVPQAAPAPYTPR